MQVTLIEPVKDSSRIRIGIVTALFNSEVTGKLETSAVEYLLKAGLSREQIFLARVPGAVEVPVAALHFLEAGVDGVVALGCVIQGQTKHFDYVCQSVERGCTELQLRFGKPVGFGILTVDTLSQALARSGGDHGDKGMETAETVIEMIRLTKQIKNQIQ